MRRFHSLLFLLVLVTIPLVSTGAALAYDQPGPPASLAGLIVPTGPFPAVHLSPRSVITAPTGLDRIPPRQPADAVQTGPGLPEALSVTSQAAVSPLAMAQALAAEPTTIIAAQWLTQPHSASGAVFTKALTYFPTDAASYVALSTGDSGAIGQAGSIASTGWAYTNVRGDTDFDVTIWAIALNVPAGANCLSLNFQFLSEEFPSWIGSDFNDAFIGELDESTWTTADSEIIAPNNFIFDQTGSPITVNSVVGLAATHGAGTVFDGGPSLHGGGTELLTALTPISPGPHTLYLSIFDQQDNIVDSAVFIDNLRFYSAETTDCQVGVTTPTHLYLPLLFNKAQFAPDLIIESLSATENDLTLTLKNIGTAPVVDPFWVDVYIGPNPAPTQVNQHWWQLAGQGAVWGVNSPLAVGETLTLGLADAYYDPGQSAFQGPIIPGTPVWAQVDSVNLNSSYGGVFELHEINQGSYNNLRSAISTGAASGEADQRRQSGSRPVFSTYRLPARAETP